MANRGPAPGPSLLVLSAAALLQRADTVLSRRAPVSAARAVAVERARRRRWQREEEIVALLPRQREPVSHSVRA
jgi:hypothetical protein